VQHTIRSSLRASFEDLTDAVLRATVDEQELEAIVEPLVSRRGARAVDQGHAGDGGRASSSR